MADIPVGVLETLLQQDGIEVPQGAGENRMVKCWNTAAHSQGDRTPSMSVNFTKGAYNCHGCGMKGGAYSYLLEARGYDKTKAIEVLKGFGWGDERFDYAKEQEEAKTKKKKGVTAFAVPGVLEYWRGQKIIARYDYRDKAGQIIASKGRYPKKEDPEKKDIRAYVPGEQNWWMTTPWSDTIPEGDRCDVGGIPIYHLDEIEKAKRTWTVWLVEGEKDVDNIRNVQGHPKGTPPPVTCLFTQKRASLKYNDLTPLAGRKVLLFADQDEPGRNEMKAIGQILADKYECFVRFVLPPGDGGYSVGDAAAAGGWEGAMAWVEEQGIHEYGEVFKADDRVVEETITRRGIDLSSNDHFFVMGRTDANVVIRTNSLHEIRYFNANQLQQPGTLLDIAPRDFWTEVCGTASFAAPGARHVITDIILRIAEKKGLINMARIMLGRGAFKDGDRCYFYMGDHVLAEDTDGKMATHMGINEVTTRALRPGPHLHVTKHSRAREYAHELAECLHEYRWERPSHAMAFVGWIVTALVGGALPFRPMLWLLGPAGSGKTYLVDPVLKAIHGNALLVISNETEAGISEAVRDDSLPVWIDEFEPTKGREDRVQHVLAYMRQSSSGEALRARGGPQSANNVIPRASICFSSVHQVNLGQANEQRIVTLRLTREGLPVEEWMKLEERFRGAIEPKKMGAVRQWIIENTAWVVKRADKIREALLRQGHTTRDSQIYGALSAGAELMFGEEKALTPPTIESASEVDEWRPMEILLDTAMPMGGGRQSTLGIAIMKIMDPERIERQADKELYSEFLENHGVAYRDINSTQQFLEPTVLFVPTSEAIKKVFKGTEYENVNLKRCLGGLKGMEEDQTRRFQIGAVRYRVLSMKVAQLRRLSFL